MRIPGFPLLLFLAAVLGLAIGWGVNYGRYGKYNSYFGEYSIGGNVSPVNISDLMSVEGPSDGAKLNVVGGPSFDFGTMAADTEGEHEFVVENVGQRDLKLRIGESTCKCTLGSLDQDTLKPGESTKIKLSWTVKTNEDTFGQSADLHTNDPNNAIVPLKISGRIIRQFEFSPKQITFGSVATGETIDEVVRLYVYNEDKIDPTELKITDPDIDQLTTYDIRELEPSEFDKDHQSAKQGFEFSLQIAPGIPQGNVSQNLRIQFASAAEESQTVAEEDQRYMFVPLQGSVVGKLRMVTTSKLRKKTDGGYLYLFGKLPSDEPTTATALVILKGDDRDDLSLKIDEVTPNVVSAVVGEPKRQKTMTLIPIEIEITPDGESHDYRGLSGLDKDYGQVVLSTDSDDGTKMVLYLDFAILNP